MPAHDHNGKPIVWAETYNKIMNLIFGQFLLAIVIITAIGATIFIIFSAIRLSKAKTVEDRKTQLTRIVWSVVGLLIAIFVEVGIPLIIKASAAVKKQITEDAPTETFQGYISPNIQNQHRPIQTKSHTYRLSN